MNYSTEQVDLWLSNDEPLYLAFNRILATFKGSEEAAKALEELVRGYNFDSSNIDMDHVSWVEIIEDSR